LILPGIPSIVVGMATVYILRCADNSLYIGWTEDLDARIDMHNQGRGGRYTARRMPVALVFAEQHDTPEAARARERQLKHCSARKKEALINGDFRRLRELTISHRSPRYKETPAVAPDV